MAKNPSLGIGNQAALTSYVDAVAPTYGLDPRAVLAVASQEGLSGKIGDNGTSFGPWQLHKGGEYPATAPQSQQEANEWAWSVKGVNYALKRMSNVARGKSGSAAIVAIVDKFERPANKAAEIAGAERDYAEAASGKVGSAGGTSAVSILKHLADLSPAGLAAQESVSAVQDARGVVKGTESVGSFLGKLTDPSFLLRGLEVVGGAVLALLGLYMLGRMVGLAPSPAQVAAVTPVGRGAKLSEAAAAEFQFSPGRAAYKGPRKRPPVRHEVSEQSERATRRRGLAERAQPDNEIPF
jgi:hypothetical protein